MVHYAIGDVHGCYDELRVMYEKIEKDFALLCVVNPDITKKKPVIVMLGDYIDRGPDSKKVVDFLITRSEMDEIFDWVFLKGNHEDMMFEDHENWVFNGGMETVESYNKVFSGFINDPSVLELVEARHYNFFKKLKLSYRAGKLAFAHAGLDPNKSFEQQSASTLMWSRTNYNGVYHDGMTVVHGHTPVLNRLDIMPNPKYPNRVNLDGGCVFGGKLLAARFNDENNPSVDELFSVSNTSKRKRRW